MIARTLRDDALTSKASQIERLAQLVRRYSMLPFADKGIPGSVLEAALAEVRGGRVLNTYDFVDVIHPDDRIGWQVKSTMEKTPVTWKRAKIPNRDELVAKSHQTPAGAQALGDAIIDFCNHHAAASIIAYGLHSIGYARLIVHPDRTASYFERLLCTSDDPTVFEKRAFRWQWSVAKATKGKEQLPALHGIHVATGKKWFAWHGLGENQLHFSGEGTWWPNRSTGSITTISLARDTEKLSVEAFIDLLASLETVK